MALELPDSAYVRSVAARGDLYGASVGFRNKRNRWEQKNGEAIRTVEAAQVIEVALVHLPAYPDALITVGGAFSPKRAGKRPAPNLDAARAWHVRRRYPDWRVREIEGRRSS